MNAEGKITRLVLDNGTEIPCDLVIVAAGVRSAVAGMDGEGIVIDRGLQVNEYLETGACRCLRSRRCDRTFRNLAECPETGGNRSP